MSDVQDIREWVAARLDPVLYVKRDVMATLLNSIEELEIRIADKDASIAQLIGQLEKAEAQLAGVTGNEPRVLVEGRCSRCGKLALFADHAGCAARTLGETK